MVQWAHDPETGENLPIDMDEESKAALRAFHDSICAHAIASPKRIALSNGAVQVRTCCDECGDSVGNPMKQTDKAWVDSLPWRPADQQDDYERRRKRDLNALLLQHARRQKAERGRFSHEYRAYLASPEWAERRTKVIRRCGNICEGCGDAPVAEVHHQTYRHFGDEFLFELLGLCEPCHDRIHKDDIP